MSDLIEIECGFTDPPHVHTYPADWLFGGADGLHPGADKRFLPTTYTYYDADTTELTVSQIPLCDDEALDYFTKIAQIKGSNPRWCSAKRPGGKLEMLPFLYDKASDTVYPSEVSNG